jgi:ankyrin repeat protein
MGTLLLSSAAKRYTEVHYYNASAQGQLEELEKVLEQGGIDINWAHPDNGETAVYAAAEYGHDKCLSAIIRHGGADLSKMDKDGRAPIHQACDKGRIACLLLLLDNGVNANLIAGDGSTPALLCCGTGHVKCLALLLDCGADPSMTFRYGITLAHTACSTGQLKCLQLLIARGANFNSKDAAGNTPLDLARSCGHSDCVELLIENKAQGKRAEDIIPVAGALKVRMCVIS